MTGSGLVTILARDSKVEAERAGWADAAAWMRAAALE